jgi:hypothetical protein
MSASAIISTVPGVVTVWVGSLAVPMVIDDLAWVTARLGASTTERQLAARITSGVKPGSQIDLSPGSAAEQDVLAAALSELIWERRGGQLVRRLRDAVLNHPPDTAKPLDQPDSAYFVRSSNGSASRPSAGRIAYSIGSTTRPPG